MTGPEVVKCPECPSTAIVNDGNDVSDTAYRLKCPVLHNVLIQRGGAAADIDCPHLAPLIRFALLKLR
jgi:hypothetical protein